MADLFVCEIPSPLGTLTLCSDGESLTGLRFAGQKGEPCGAEALEKRGLPVFQAAAAWLSRYFAGERPLPGELPLRSCGSGFQEEVWALLREIPYGQVTSYGNLAKKIAAKTGCAVSGRAVGQAIGCNPISIIVPCHRVIGADGSLTGYSGGLEAKRRLLEIEGFAVEGGIAVKRGYCKKRAFLVD